VGAGGEASLVERHQESHGPGPRVVAGGGGTRAVLEVRSHDVPFVIEDGQTIGRLLFEPLTERPAELYGRGIGSSYQRQGLALAKQFRHADPHDARTP